MLGDWKPDFAIKRADFLIAIYEVGGASTFDLSLIRHNGREYGYVINGTLSVQIAWSTDCVGDSIAST